VGQWTRVKDAYRRVGVKGIVGDLHWRWRTLLKGRTTGEALGDLNALIAEEGLGGLSSRLRYGVLQLRYPEVEQQAAAAGAEITERPEWLDTFAYHASQNPFFDLSAEEREANRAVVERFADRAGDVRSATWFLTYFEHALFGGVHTILRLMAYMTEVHGVEHRLVVFDRQTADHDVIRRAITEVFPSLEGIDIVLPVDGAIAYDELPPTDISIATIWISAYASARFNRVKAKFYMVQDFEPAFYPAGTLSALSDATYRFGFAGLVNTPGLGEIYASYGNPAVSFVPAVEAVSDNPVKPSAASGAPVQVVLYGRPSTDRNAFELIASACVQIKERLGDGVRIVSAGEAFDPDAVGLGGVVENLGLLTTLEEVRDLYADSDIGVCFMLSKHPSYQPFEYLAAHAVPVCNVNPATGWMLRHEENCLLTEPFPGAIADAVVRLAEDASLRRKLAETGHAQVTGVSWRAELDEVWGFTTGERA
jgi:O-antigen biosynthesis protein